MSNSEDILATGDAINWKNNSIIDYYENIPVAVFRDFAIKGGFENGCDIDLAYSYISDTNSILDIGSAYGRVINHLIKKGYEGKIYAIERSKKFFEYLKQHYSSKVEITHAAIQQFEPAQKFNAILWMWSGINDFAKDEQLSILKRISTWLEPKGVLILETLLHTLTPKNASISEKNWFAIFSEYGSIYSYKTSKEEIQGYGEQLGFQYIKHVDYETDTQRQRILHILSHKPI